MHNQKAASRYSTQAEKRRLWRAAIKWPLYSVAIMPVLLAAGWQISTGEGIRIDQFFGFLIASILLLLWENLTNDLFDAETGVDEFKAHSVVALLGESQPVKKLAYLSLLLGLFLILLLSIRTSPAVLWLVIGSCLLGYLYQGPPFRLGYKGLGEPLCWVAFGPLATAASLLALSPNVKDISSNIPWRTAFMIGSGPALATTLVLFCSHFHQVAEDAAHGKQSPLVRLGTKRAADIVPWLITITLVFELIPILIGEWPKTALLFIICLPSGITLINLLKKHHNQPNLISGSKFVALRFQSLNGLGLSIGFALKTLFEIN